MGYDAQSWSAALYLYARDAVQRGALRIFDSTGGWTLA